MNLADGFDVVLRAALKGARPDPILQVDEWSEGKDHMILPPDSPGGGGPYRIEKTPMARGILQALSPRHPARRVVVMGASQMLKTQIALCFLMARAHMAPGNMLVLEPSDTLARRLSARIARTIRDSPVLRTVFAPPRSRDSRNTTFAKDFTGGTMHIATAGSAANLAEIPAPIIVIDEVDRMESSVGKEGDPVLLAEARATAFESSAKFYEVSSPLHADSSKIAELYAMGTQAVYLVPCPHCSHHHELVLSNFHYARDPATGHMARAWFTCPECGVDIEERHKRAMLRDAPLGGTAHWHARSTGDGETYSFHVSAFYAPSGSITWLRLARQHSHALDELKRGNPHPMQVFVNTRLALPWRDDSIAITTAQELQERQIAEQWAARIVPDRALVVTISVDTQPSCLEVQAEAWGPGLENWVIDYVRLNGSPTVAPDVEGSVWARLDVFRRQAFQHASGMPIVASVYLIDSGGANTQDVYHYGAIRVHAGAVVIHGATRYGRPVIADSPTKVDVDWQGNKIDGGALLWQIGTDTAKDYIHARFANPSGNPEGAAGDRHFAITLPPHWFEGLLVERPFPKRTPGGGYRYVWQKPSHSDWNAPLDLSVYNLAAAYHLGLHRWSSLDWQALRDRLLQQQAQRELDARTTSSPTPPAAAAAPAQSGPIAVPYVGRRMLNPGRR